MMGRKTKQQQLQERLDKMMTVADLIEHLKTMDPTLKVGRSGHFGEMHEMTKHDFYAGNPTAYVTPDGPWSWREEPQVHVSFVNVNSPDIGPDPD